MTLKTSRLPMADSAFVASDSLAATEFAFSVEDFDQIRTLLKLRTGISLSEGKRSMVYSRLVRRLRATGSTSFRSYIDTLRGGAPEWEHFVNALTTNLTYFYRENHHFPILSDHMKQRARAGHTLQIWCAAASTGEEAWTIALTAAEAFGSMSPPVRIMATDIDTSVLETARKGVYCSEQVAKIPEALLRRYFVQDSHQQYAVRDELRALVTFRQLNLRDSAWPVNGPFDAVFCRNVLIYFDRETQLGIVSRMAALMPADALLFVGHSENFSHGQHDFLLQGKTVYVRKQG